MEYDIFISYSRDDSAIVNTFVQRLEAAGYKVWIDKTGIYTGSRFKSVLVQAIEDSKVFLFFSSKGANASPWTAKEVAIAVDRKKTIIPIKLDNTRYNREVEFDLIGLDYVDYRNKFNCGQEFNKLMRTLETFLGKKQPTAPNPVAQTGQKEIVLSLLNNHRRWVIPLVAISILLLIVVPLYFSSTETDHSLKVEKQVESEAEKNYKKAAEQGDAEAQYNLGRCYYDGDGVTQNYNMAVQWFKKAAEQGHALAQYKIGVCYDRSYGVNQDYKEAVKWYREAAEQGYSKAQFNLGVCYYDGEGVNQNYEAAAKWYRKAAEQGHSKAQFNLGLCYYDGKGVNLNHEESAKWYRKAAEQGHSNAQFNLGICYMKGDGVTQDYSMAVQWFEKVAEQGGADAQYCLGLCYENGYGVTNDKEKALEWYRKAAGQGYKDAQKAVERLTP